MPAAKRPFAMVEKGRAAIVGQGASTNGRRPGHETRVKTHFVCRSWKEPVVAHMPSRPLAPSSEEPTKVHSEVARVVLPDGRA